MAPGEWLGEDRDRAVTHLRVMTYNIWQGGRERRLLAQVVRAAAPDVLLVNETPKAPLLWHRKCLQLADEWGLEYVVGGRPAGSNAVMVRSAVEVEDRAALVIPQPLLRPRRGIAAAQLRVRGRPLGVVSCHLSLDASRRPEEVSRVVEVADRLRGPVVVGGDLNERPQGACWHALRRSGYLDLGAGDWPTFPAAAPAKRIDALLVRGEVRVLHHGDPGVARDIQAAASDHRPVLADLDLDA